MSWSVLQGDCLSLMREMEPGSVDCIVTSPPYWSLRDYGVADAWGLEPTLGEYLDRMRSLGQELMRVLKPSGTFWLNMGDAYASAWPCSRRNVIGEGSLPNGKRENRPERLGESLKEKDLIGLPWRVVFALQEQGWYLRSDIIWAKPNPMPESVRDRPTRAHEYVFLLTKSKRYAYDADAIRTEFSPETKQLSYDTMDYKRRDQYKTPDGWDTTKGEGGHGSIHKNGREKGKKPDKQHGHSRRHDGFNDRWDQMEKQEQIQNGANARTVWTIATQPYPEAHFATFPQELPKRCILAGCPEGGLVLDPFAGSGTTLEVAVRLGRNAVGLELNPDYVRLIEKRMQTVTPSLFSKEAG